VHCVGAYAEGLSYDVLYGDLGERSSSQENIEAVALPKQDPVLGMRGPIHSHWKLL
jgi:uncharacterized protein YjlB